ncbi:Retrovirus-related Pol polyprotein from transposon TNT 1-94 [Dendrobium catenatum]|uniref:Retrovirus-related Pol polyprotein from transposon TNT 1-94 n=1 Tax=Dendrobium catenatum TaxID=906689 RepID=A0A2I0WKU9_9ASPA|nr:Retrovirus-related Pol polyprotein from transposon TNT 1-94 [Dendrobium catenatum]
MKPSELIFEMYTRFTQIVTFLHALGRELINYKKVNKVLRCLPSSFDAKITAIIEFKDLNTYLIDNLLGSLIAYEKEINQKNLDAGEKRMEKIVALKVNDTDNNSSGSESDDVSFITRQFKNFLRKNNNYHQKLKRGKDSKNFKNSSDLVCYECRKPGHVKTDCPTLKEHPSMEKDEEKPKFRKDKKRVQNAF